MTEIEKINVRKRLLKLQKKLRAAQRHEKRLATLDDVTQEERDKLAAEKAELMKGSRIRGYEKALAPSIVLAFKPGMTASHVNASIKRRRMPMTASHSRKVALERNPMMRATPMITAIEMELEKIEVTT